MTVSESTTNSVEKGSENLCKRIDNYDKLFIFLNLRIYMTLGVSTTYSIGECWNFAKVGIYGGLSIAFISRTFLSIKQGNYKQGMLLTALSIMTFSATVFHASYVYQPVIERIDTLRELSGHHVPPLLQNPENLIPNRAYF